MGAAAGVGVPAPPKSKAPPALPGVTLPDLVGDSAAFCGAAVVSVVVVSVVVSVVVVTIGLEGLGRGPVRW